MKESGFFWHKRYDTLLGWCYSCYRKRAARSIRNEKSEHERETHLRLFQPIKEEVLPQEVIEARRAYDEARQARDKANRMYKESWLLPDGAKRAYDKAERARVKARQVLDEVINKNMPAIEALHATECPNCPWDGHTIFPK